MDDFYSRFGGIARLYSREALDRLRDSHVAVVGLGGVGSWVVEALARSGVGRLTLIDLDEVCLSNVNRQLPAVDGAIGRFKAEVLAERVRAINPSCTATVRIEFFTDATAQNLFDERTDFVVDAIDTVSNKARLVAFCKSRGFPILVSGGAGGRRDPTRLHIADLAMASHDRLLAEIRRRLRRDYGFPAAGQNMGVACVFSDEPPMPPPGESQQCEAQTADAPERGRRLNCDSGYGSAVFVTGAFGFAAAAWVIQQLLQGETRSENGGPAPVKARGTLRR